MTESLDRRVRSLALRTSVAAGIALSGCGGGSGSPDGLATAQSAAAPDVRTAAVQTVADDAAVTAAKQNLNQWVNPFIGTQIGNTS